ncbi:hypothetical protein F0L17_14725 [Streptomyces sp. TRM43335]|uniref:Uncharacterized protein n=1 Tax=Streptomyces taklimakanensis TaxID=2569853 RepID=A0A6G2BE33_9ACTN|nr:hypothetical protein [Streptomyces taklimakanensis]MTE20339.1 hypothetical protein [Streptomyces taklimakanensis]
MVGEHVAPAIAVVLLAGAATGCVDRAEPGDTVVTTEKPSAPSTASPTASAPASTTASPTTSAPASTTTSPTTSAPASTAPTPPTTAPVVPVPSGTTRTPWKETGPAVPPPPRPAELEMSVTTAGGTLDLVRGGPAREFTVTVRNGTARAYGGLRLVFQMEVLEGAPAAERPEQRGFVLERRHAGAWHDVGLRVANDFTPHWLYDGGFRLDRGAVRTERYRLRALSSGPTGSTPLMVHLFDTDAPRDAPADRSRPAYRSLPHTTRLG